MIKTKKELLNEAKAAGVEADDSMTNAEIQERINGAGDDLSLSEETPTTIPPDVPGGPGTIPPTTAKSDPAPGQPGSELAASPTGEEKPRADLLSDLEREEADLAARRKKVITIKNRTERAAEEARLSQIATDLRTRREDLG